MAFESRWVMVTGASSGLGQEMSRVLARDHRANLVLVARRADRLKQFADELTREHKVQVKTIPADLAREDEAVRVFEEATREPLYAAVLNAGVTHFGHHDELSWPAFRDMLSLNVITTTRLTTLLLPYLEQRKEAGGLMLVSSMSGMTPLPYQAAYSATKAYLVNLGGALHLEMLPRGVSVTTFAPGGIATEMTAGERFNSLRGWLMPAGKCAQLGVRALQQREYLSVPGFVYSVGAYLQRLMPQKFFMKQVAARYRKSLAENAATEAARNAAAPAKPGQ